MEQLLDKEYTDPSWRLSEKDGENIDIFSLCEFTKLENSEIIKLLQNYNLQIHRVLKTEFTVAYDYCFQGWFENRARIFISDSKNTSTDYNSNDRFKK